MTPDEPDQSAATHCASLRGSSSDEEARITAQLDDDLRFDGLAAYTHGHDREDNPHPRTDTHARRLWFIGWDTGHAAQGN